MPDPNEKCDSRGKVRDDKYGFPHYFYCDPGLPLDEEYSKANPWNGAPFGVGVQRDQTPVMPSAEAHFFDYSQHRKNIQELADGPSGINYLFPSPSSVSAIRDTPIAESQYSPEWWAVSGIYKTFGADVQVTTDPDQTGVFHFNNLKGQFSNTGTKDVAVDFNLFFPFVHHGNTTDPVLMVIPYVSDYIIAKPYFPYPV